MDDSNLATSTNDVEDQPDEPTSATGSEDEEEVTLEQVQAKLKKLEEANKELVSQRDKNFSKNESLEGRLDAIEAEKERDSFIKTFLEENAEKYSFVEKEDLLAGQSPADIEAIAKRVQKKGEDIQSKALAEIQKVKTPTPLTGEEKEKRLTDLKERAAKGESTFEEMLELQEA